MAVMTLYRVPLGGSGIGTITGSPTKITIRIGSITQNYYGSGFTFSRTGVTGGTVTSIDLRDTSNGGLQYTITGLALSAPALASRVLSGNPEAALAYVLGGADTINGSRFGELLQGLGGNDVLNGNAGDDRLIGGAGADRLAGGAGNDRYIMDSGDTATEKAGGGDDTIESSVSRTLGDHFEWLVLTGKGNTTGTGNSARNTIKGNAGNNQLLGLDGNDTLAGGAGRDTLIGGKGDDRYTADAQDIVTEKAGQGNDTVFSGANHTLRDHIENLELTGNDNIRGTGNIRNNVISGNGGNNVLDGGGGADQLFGKAGNDTLIAGSGADADLLIGEDGNDSLVGSAGADTLNGGEGDDVYVPGDTANVIVDSGGSDTITGVADGFVLTALEIENFQLGSTALSGTGSEVGNVIGGNSLGNALAGLGGDDTLLGMDGDDVLDGGEGADSLVGGNGADSLDGGAGDDSLLGEAGTDSLSGGAGDDTLVGGEGIDTLVGGDGDDTYVLEGADIVDEAGESDSDTVQSAASISLESFAHVENLALLGSSDATGTGNELDNRLDGNDGGNALDGGAGNDTLFGGAGDDTLTGGEGNDSLSGGDGVDTLSGGAGDDSYVVSDGSDIIVEEAGGGSDTIVSFGDLELEGEIENLLLQGTATSGIGSSTDNRITGNAALESSLSGREGNDTLFGGAAGDTLSGGAGVDVLEGGGGDDVYLIEEGDGGDVIVEGVGAGNDIVRTTMSYALGDNVEQLRMLGSDDISATGNSAANSFFGNIGNNSFDGGAGADHYEGGLGNDTYALDGTDTFFEAQSGGGNRDTILVGESWTLVLLQGIEDVTLTGDSEIDAAGNHLSNVLTGNSAANYLYGGESNVDTLIGGGGDDTLDGGDFADVMAGGTGNDYYFYTGDTITELAEEGNDTMAGSLFNNNFLAANVEVLVLLAGAGNGLGTAADDTIIGNGDSNLLDGNAGADFLVGGAGLDTMDGDTGADTMEGGDGGDIYIMDDAGDKIVEMLDGGSDTVRAHDSFSIEFLEHVENVTLQFSSTGLNITGNDHANVLTGNNKDNHIIGGGGDDWITGDEGDDTLDGGAGNDTLWGERGADTYIVDSTQDVIFQQLVWDGSINSVLASATYSLASQNTASLHNLTLTGTDDINGTGNGFDNAITGNSGSNELSGGLGLDTLDGGDGTDTLLGGDGNDRLVWDADDASLDGGADTDTLRIVAGDLDLTEVDDAKIVSVEQIDLSAGGENTLTLAESDVLAMSSSGLKIFGDGEDTVAIDGDFTPGDVTNGFRAYTVGTATLLIDTDITVTAL